MELNEALASAFDTAPADTAPAIETPAVDVEQTTQPEGRARDEAGRFAAKAADTKPADPAALTAENQPATQPEAPKTRVPSSWKKEVAAIWEKADRGEPLTSQEIKAIQDEALRREGDFHKGIETWRSGADKAKAFDQVLAPYQDTFKQLGVEPTAAISALLQADNTLRNGPPTVKLQKLLELAQVYGIDLSQQPNPDVARYEAELFATRQQLDQFKRDQEAASMNSLNSDIEAFKSAPGHEHFEDVRAHMASLLQGGAAQTLEEAYDMAVYANPTTRASLLEQQRKAAAEAAQAQRARSAAVSVRGSSPASTASTVADKGSVRDAVAAAFDAHTT